MHEPEYETDHQDRERQGGPRQPVAPGPDERAQEQPPEVQLLDDRAPEADEQAEHDKPRAVDVRDQRVRRLGDAVVEVRHERRKRPFQRRHEEVLGRDAAGDPERHVRPEPE